MVHHPDHQRNGLVYTDMGKKRLIALTKDPTLHKKKYIGCSCVGWTLRAWKYWNNSRALQDRLIFCAVNAQVYVYISPPPLYMLYYEHNPGIVLHFLASSRIKYFFSRLVLLAGYVRGSTPTIYFSNSFKNRGVSKK